MQHLGERIGKDIKNTKTIKQACVTVLTSDKVDIKPKLTRRDKESHCILIKGIVNQEGNTIPRMYAFQDHEWLLLYVKTQINVNTIIVGDLTTSLAPIDRHDNKTQREKHLS